MVQPCRQWLPLDPPGAELSSMGAIAACASSGPLRLGFGTPRDYVIGLSLAHADGTRSKCGGKVVKNVAGYDMNKLYVGSFGTLAVITELIVKLKPLYESSATAVIRARDLLELARRIKHSELRPSSLNLVGGQLIGPTRLLVRFVEKRAAVNYQLDRLKELAVDGQIERLEAAPEQLAWAEVANLDRLAENALRMSVRPSAAGQLYLKLSAELADSAIAADLGVGIIRIAFDADLGRAAHLIASLRSEASALGGALFVERAPPEVKARVDAWGQVGPTERLMREIKDKFDPKRILNPGRFACGI
jgi:glycolate oxidase FAD binding subunit